MNTTNPIYSCCPLFFLKVKMMTLQPPMCTIPPPIFPRRPPRFNLPCVQSPLLYFLGDHHVSLKPQYFSLGPTSLFLIRSFVLPKLRLFNRRPFRNYFLISWFLRSFRLHTFQWKVGVSNEMKWTYKGLR